MGNQLLASKTVIQEEAPSVVAVTALPTAVLAIVGVTERGPVNTPILIQSFEEYLRKFGTFTANSDLILTLRGYFQNGGEFAYVNRIVHYTDITNPASLISAAATLMLQTAVTAPTKGTVLGTATAPFDLTPGDDLDFSVDGGGTDTATIDAAAASLECVNAETYDLADSLTLTVKIDGEAVAQTIIFNTAEFADIANATAEEVAAVINAEIIGAGASATTGGTKVTITSDKQGTGSGVEVTGGTANTGGANRLGFSTSPVAGTGDVADINAVTVAELKTVIEADVTGVTVTDVGSKVQVETNTVGAGGSIQVEATSTADDEIGFDNATHSGSAGTAQDTLKVDGKTDGAYANDYSITIDPPTNGDTGYFNFVVENSSGQVLEIFPNLQGATSGDADFVDTVVNDADTGSNLVVVTDQGLGFIPAEGTFGPMAGGDDGLTGLADTDFIGDEAGENGLRAFDPIAGITLLSVPGQATTAVQQGMITYAEDERDRAVFCILDPPASQTAVQIVTYVESGGTALLESSENAAIYWPRLKILNPNKTVLGDTKTLAVPPSGYLAGMYARTDSSKDGGIYEPPAGTTFGKIRGTVGVETTSDDEPAEVEDERKRDLVYPKRINPLTPGPGGPFADGTRTLKSTGNFPTIAERRGASHIEQDLKVLTDDRRHSRNKDSLLSQLNRDVFAYLLGEMRDEAFASDDPEAAFKIDFGKGLNQPIDQFRGKVTGRVGLAFAKPADWIILKFGADLSAVEEQLEAAGL
jgi:hypothetical protein